ncbi:MAG: hypothetical protein ACKPKO_58985, partial [Candidatus Fonsibacter sp.]
ALMSPKTQSHVMQIVCYYWAIYIIFCVLSNHGVCGVSRGYFCAEDIYFRRAANGHDDDEKHIAELVKSVRQCHTGRKRARSVAQLVEYH